MNTKRFYLIGFFLILALPVFTSSPWFSPAPWGKAIIFRIIISILIFITLYKIIYKKADYEHSIDKNLLPFWFLALLFVIFLLATIFSLDPHYSFWDSPLRAGGFLNFSFYIIFALLVFLFVNKKQWQRLWDFSILIGSVVSIIAILQHYNAFKNIIIPYSGRPPSTIGGPTFLALYLLLLVFITICFIIKSIRNLDRKWFFYLPALLLFIYVILITGSRAAYFGLLIGFIYFIFSYPKKNKLIILSKITFLVILILIACGVYYANIETDFPDYFKNNKLIKEVLPRLSINQILANPRFSAWVISLEAIKERPLLGYGPENFSIAFDKHYDPLLPYISKNWGSWYDKAHSFLFEIAVTVGIPGLIIFISLFASLFWELQKLKEKSLTAHGIQATFLAYFANTLFSFDLFSTYLILFLLIAYSLSLISKPKPKRQLKQNEEKELKPTKPIIVSLLFLILVWFIWSYNLKPLSINKEINWADYYVRTDQCEKAIEQMETNVLSSKSIIDSYAKLKYIDVIVNCDEKIPGLKITSAPKAISTLEQAAEIRPYYTRTWLFLGNFTNLLIANSSYFEINNLEELKEQAYSYFETAYELSPKHEQVFVTWMQTDLLFRDYQTVKERAEQCVKFNPGSAYCWWTKGICNIYLYQAEQGVKDIETAAKQGYNITSEKSLSQLSIACEGTGDAKCFGKLADIYYDTFKQTLASDSRYHLYLAYISAIGEKEEILKEQIRDIFRTWPELEKDLIDTLEYVNDHTNKIDMKVVELCIDGNKRRVEIGVILEDLINKGVEANLSTIKRYKDESQEIKEFIDQMKLIKK